MKHISKEEFFKQLNSCEYGRQYLELVNNPENHLGKMDKGEVHHIHPKKMGGDLKAPENLVKLTTFNHCLAHVLLAKTAMQLHSNWIGEALMPIVWLGQGQQFHSLSELEKITLEDIYNWSELIKLGHKKQAECTKGKPAWNSGKKCPQISKARKGQKLSEETKQKIRENNRANVPEVRKKISKKLKGRVFTEEHKQKISIKLKGKKTGKPSWNSGKHGIYTEEQLNKMGRKNKGSIHMNNGIKNITVHSREEAEIKLIEGYSYGRMETIAKGCRFMNKDGVVKQVLKQDIEKYKELGWNFGKGEIGKNQTGMIFINNGIEIKRIWPYEINNYPGWIKGMLKGKIHWTDEQKKNLSNSCKGRISSMKGKHHSNIAKEKLSKVRLGKIWINNGKINKVISEGDLKLYISMGWNNGMIANNHKWINNGIISKQIKLEELDSYLNNGWVIGRIKKVV